MAWFVISFGLLRVTMCDLIESVIVMPLSQGSVDNPSTRGIHVAIECLNARK